MLNSYESKIKCIYIDPPYNTGSDDFVYPDNFKYDKQTLIKLGLTEEEAERVENLYGKSTHSAWLTFMLPRLTLARELLSDDGVIFISIDDNEQANLKLLCDEVFGEENFNVVFPRVTKKGGKSSDVTAKNHDFVLMYVKNKNNSDLIGISHIDSGYSNKDEFFDIRGFYKLNQTLDYDSLGYVQSLDYPIVIDDETFYAGGNKENYENRQNGQHGRADWGWRWRWSKELYEFGKKNGFIEIKRGGNRPRIYTKTYEKVKIENINGEYKIIEFDRTKPLSTLEFTDNKYSNDNATKVIDNLIGKGVFEYTKPPELNIQLSNLVNKKNFTILDFFSGSATTAHAVMQLNAEDGGNRKYILVNIPEPTKENTEAFKAGYKTICDIGIARIKKAAEKIKNVTNADIDYGFKIYELNTLSERTLNDIESFEEANSKLFADDMRTSFEFSGVSGEDTILQTWKVDDGFGFIEKHEEVSLNDCLAYKVKKVLYLINPTMSDFVKPLIEKLENELKDVNKIVVLGYSYTFVQLQSLDINIKNFNDIKGQADRVKVEVRY